MVDTVIVEAETPAVSAVSWPAIIAGGFVAAAFTLLLLALGAGIGFSVISPWSGLARHHHDQGCPGRRHLYGRHRSHGFRAGRLHHRPAARALDAGSARRGLFS